MVNAYREILKMKNAYACLAGALAFVTLSVAQESYGQWKYVRTVNVNTTASGSNVATNQVKFPMLLRFGASDSLVFSTSQSTGADIRFSKSDGTPMKHQIERWDAANKVAEVWVLVDTVYGNDSTHFFKMYWGNNLAPDSSNGAAVFDAGSGFAGAWHFQGGNFADATANHNNGTDHGSKDTTGVIAGARVFHGTNANPQYVSVADAASLNITNNLTLSAWIKPSAWATNNRIIQKNGTGGGDDQYRFYASSATAIRLTLTGTSGTTPTLTAPSVGAWHLVHATYDGANLRLYVDGAQGATAAITGNINVASGELWFGAKPLAQVDADYSNLAMDEPRVSNRARSADWIKLEFQNQKAASVGISFGVSILQPPSGLSYLQNPAVYTVNYAAGSNLPVMLGGAATKYSISPSLPAGLRMDTNTGVISGTPTVAAGAANYTVTASNAAGSTTAQVNITVNATLVAPTGLSYRTNPVVYFVNAAITNNNPVVTGTVTGFSVSPALPAGLTLNTTTGVISGTPTAGVAAANYTVSASNPAGSTTVQLNLAVIAGPSNLSYANSNAVYFVGTPITANVPSLTGAATSFSSNPPLSTIGLAINPTTGVITGTPSAFQWTTDYIITASNPAGSTTTTVTITVYVPVGIRIHSKSVSFRLPDGAVSARLSVVDMRGRAVWNRTLQGSEGPMFWNGEGTGLGSGIYAVRMILLDAKGHSMGILERRMAWMP
ncbi:MAG TPA: hypothetical protein DCQ83_03790 [Fibrobacteres bacterium]|nr:hypothetical protein [Fibrobacterota bacterium]